MTGHASPAACDSQIPKGYKQTEVGVIPEDWEITFVGREFSIQLGKMLDAEKNAGVSKPYLGNRAVQWGRIDLSDIGTVPMSPRDLSQYRLCTGDLIVCEGGEIGRAAIWYGELSECYFQKALHRLRPIRNYNVQLMFNMLYSFASSGFLANFVTQTSIAHLPKEKFATVPLPLPPTLTEQRAIATALSDTDSWIASLEGLVAKKRHLKQAAMQQLLTGQKRLPGFDGEWERKRLGDIAHIKTGERNNEDKIEDGRYPFYVRSATVERINCYSHECEAVLVPGEGGIGSIFHYVNGRFNVHQRVYAITHFAYDISGKFVYEYMRQHFGTYAMRNTVKATVDSLRLPTFQNFEILFPTTKSEQTAIASVLTDMDTEITSLESKLTKARQIKQGMMQELLTGRIRLVDPAGVS